MNTEGQITQDFESGPEFFKERGVYEPTRKIESGFGVGIIETIEAAPEDARLLRAFDTWINVDRLSASVDWQFETREQSTIATFTVIYSRQSPANPAECIHQSEFQKQDRR